LDALIFVEKVKYYCKKKGEAPTVACKNAGVGTSFISDINRGQTPSVAKVQLLAEYLGVTTSELLGEIKEPTVRNDGLTDGEQAILDLFRQLTPEQQDMVIRMVQAAADKM
jgi:transcriptional regulator with XRE-family HTH domain